MRILFFLFVILFLLAEHNDAIIMNQQYKKTECIQRSIANVQIADIDEFVSSCMQSKLPLLQESNTLK